MFELYPVYRVSAEDIEVQDDPCSEDEARSVERLGYQVIDEMEVGELIYVPGYRAYYLLLRLRAVS